MKIHHSYPLEWLTRLETETNSHSEMRYRVFSRDVTAAMLVFQNKEMAAMMV